MSYDLAALWEEHCRHEFATPDLDAVMATMVNDPYVNHIPTMTGGVGYSQVKRFYRDHLIGTSPADFHLTPISPTIGADSLVDEWVCTFTHTSSVDWMLPGIAATGHRVEVPVVAIVKFHKDKVVHEHIYWDQASVLVQIGKLDSAGLPIAGADTARKVLDKTLPSNGLMPNWVEG
jgi:carboxymethylenebutenolidase